MTSEEFYGTALVKLKSAEQQLLDLISLYQSEIERTGRNKKIEYCKSRIKSPESMIAKLKKRGLPPTRHSALHQVYDAVGMRIICPFVDDIYDIAGWLSEQPSLKTVQTKDYIAYPKSNGYRSYHMILEMTDKNGHNQYAEIQIRTIALDFWASLEHQLKYKHNIQNEQTIRSELKRCADEIASIDLSMQTIKDLIYLEAF